MSFRYVVNPQHLFALKWSLRYPPSYFNDMHGDFDFKHHIAHSSHPSKPTKDWQKARPIISFFRTWAAPFLTVFGAVIFELTKVTFPDIAGQLSVQELVQQLWESLSKADPDEYIHLVSQDLSGFFTSIPTERFHQALQVLLHRYDQVVGLRRLRRSSQWSVYEVKSDHRRRMFKGKRRRQTKVPRTFREQDLRYLLDFVIDNSHFEINGYLFRQERGVAMGSPAAPPLINLVATVEDFFWHQTMCVFSAVSHARYRCDLA